MWTAVIIQGIVAVCTAHWQTTCLYYQVFIVVNCCSVWRHQKISGLMDSHQNNYFFPFYNISFPERQSMKWRAERGVRGNPEICSNLLQERTLVIGRAINVAYKILKYSSVCQGPCNSPPLPCPALPKNPNPKQKAWVVTFISVLVIHFCFMWGWDTNVRKIKNDVEIFSIDIFESLFNYYKLINSILLFLCGYM